MWLLVGLGNPGRKYERNRHNVGFRVIDELERRHALGGFRSKFGGEAAAGMLSVGGKHHKAVLLKPQEFMNLSGFAVQRAVQFHDIEPEHIVVIHDEIDIDFGRLRLKAGGGHGGHNGLRSMIEQLGDNAFLRVRVGVGKPGPDQQNAAAAAAAGAATNAASRDRRVAGYVLSDFPADLEPQVDELVRTAANAVEAILDRGITAAMNEFHAPKSDSLPEEIRA
ncbi:MAG TPA: aminoacyl-tRNA hydrolase [Haliangium sp.]|nr:aminoacyl-tRNA hydrolase [Haliangium sp.]